MYVLKNVAFYLVEVVAIVTLWQQDEEQGEVLQAFNVHLRISFEESESHPLQE